MRHIPFTHIEIMKIEQISLSVFFLAGSHLTSKQRQNEYIKVVFNTSSLFLAPVMYTYI